MELINAPKGGGCIFCDFPAQTGEAADKKTLIVHRSAHSFTILNRFPYNSGHVMVIPRAHGAALEALEAPAFADLHEELRRTVGVIRAVYKPDGFNVGMNLGRSAGA